MKVAVVVALFAMLAVATAFYPENYYGWYGNPLYAASNYYGAYNWPYYSGWAQGYPYYGAHFNQAAADKVNAAAVAPAENAAADSAAPAAE